MCKHEFWVVTLIYEKHAAGNLLATAQQSLKYCFATERCNLYIYTGILSGTAYFKFLNYVEPVWNTFLGCLPHSYWDPGKSACNFASGCKINIFKCKLGLKKWAHPCLEVVKKVKLLGDVGFSIMFDRSFKQAEWQKAITHMPLCIYREVSKLKLFP